MSYHLDRHHRRSIRWQGYDYRQHGAYVVTIYTHNRAPIPGTIQDGEVLLSEVGKVVEQTWTALPQRLPTVALDLLVIMPNHVHCVLDFSFAPNGDGVVGDEGRESPALCRPPRSSSTPALGAVIGAFKSISAMSDNRLLGQLCRPFWQRTDHDRVLRNDVGLDRTRYDSEQNPTTGAKDPEYLLELSR